MTKNRITALFGIKYPVIQAGMVWCSGWKLASSVSNAGGLGLLGAGSMHLDVLKEHITKMKLATDKPWGVNVPMLYPELDAVIDLIINEGVKIVFTSAGSPKKYTSKLKQHGITVVHVVSNSIFAKKCEEAGVDAIVAEGFEAGGHNGREETSTMVLIPLVCNATKLPVIAAGGIGSGRGMLAAFSLGADAVQIGSRFAVSAESSAHDSYKHKVIESIEGDSVLILKKLAPVRLLKNEFSQQVQLKEEHGADIEELKNLLGKGRAKKAIFEGNLSEGEIEIGQIAASINEIKSVNEIFDEILIEFKEAKDEINTSSFMF
jgi:enoyl-[acyl-carrier protein] reductase II